MFSLRTQMTKHTKNDKDYPYYWQVSPPTSYACMQLITCILAQYYRFLNSSISYRYHTNVIRSRKRKILGVFIPIIMHTSSSKHVFKQWINYPDEDSEFRRHGFHLCSVALVSAHINPCCQTSPHCENTFQITRRHIASMKTSSTIKNRRHYFFLECPMLYLA